MTQLWWTERRPLYDLYISQLVVLEVGAGDPEVAKDRLALVQEIPRLDATAACSRLARRILQGTGLPAQATRDALHLAITAVHRLDFLMTWNCRHLANADLLTKFGSIIASEGYRAPVICTPPQLLGT